jgi:uncharacterized cupin superfamily protein
VPNVFDCACEYDENDPEGYRSGVAYVARETPAKEESVRVFEIPAGESSCPYHYEYVEEWALVLDGEVILRSPSGEQRLARGELVCFPSGPEGAHKLTGASEDPARVMMWSSTREPSVAVYPDSDKIGVWPGREEDQLMLHRTDGQVAYFDGER